MVEKFYFIRKKPNTYSITILGLFNLIHSLWKFCNGIAIICMFCNLQIRVPAGKYLYEFVPLPERALVPSERSWAQALTIFTGYFHGEYFLVCSPARVFQIQKVF